MVYQSDASEAGWGVKTARWPLEAVQACGRVSERRRFQRTGPHSACEAALGAAGLHRELGEWVCRSEQETEATEENWTADRSFPEIDPAGVAYRSRGSLAVCRGHHGARSSCL